MTRKKMIVTGVFYLVACIIVAFYVITYLVSK